MRITVKLFAGHRERAGASEIELETPDGVNAGEAFDLLTARHPSLGSMKPFTFFARNRQMVGATETLEDGDELALLQPVSGGVH